MAAPTFLSSMAARRASLLQTALLFSWVLLVLGQNNGCARRCANSNSEMSRCIRISCRQSAMGAIIRFGKRDRSAGERPSSGVGMMPTREVLLSPSLRENLLETLLARGPEDSLSRDLTKGSENSRQYPGISASQLRLERASNSPWFLSAPAPSRFSSAEDPLLVWLRQASKNLGHQWNDKPAPRDDDHVLNPDDDDDDDDDDRHDNDGDDKKLNGLSLSPLTYQDLSGLLEKQAPSVSVSASTSGTDENGSSVRDWPRSQPQVPSMSRKSEEQMRRQQRGLLKHVIRFG